MHEDPGLKETFHKFGLISELVQREAEKKIQRLFRLKITSVELTLY